MLAGTNFDGVCRSASVWFNGCFLGDNYSGYVGFSFDISDLSRYGAEGENVILIIVDTTTGQEGWWYEGAGIYRNVYLEITSPICIDKYGIHVSTEKVEDNKAYLSIETTLKNSEYNDINVKLEILISNYDDILGQITKKLPNTKVYVIAYYHVNKEAANNPWMEMTLNIRTNERISKTNESVNKLADKYKIRYVDINKNLYDKKID